MMRSLAFILFILNASTLWLQTSLAATEIADSLDPASFVCRTDAKSFVSVNNLPDDIISVDVKDPGNANDVDTGIGMVIQEYGIAQTEVTSRQYCYYLNQVATGENYQLFYDERMGSDRNVGTIKREMIDGKNRYTVIKDSHGDRGKFPIVYVNLYQAARFCNWLQNQNKPGLTGDDLTERGAYTLEGKSSGPIARNKGAVWFIPTESEWYKPAYYKGGGLDAGYWNFANRSDYAPANSLEAKCNNAANYDRATKQPPYLTEVNHFNESVGAYNTLDMSGNVAEWVATEEEQGTIPLRYVARGGSWKSSYYGQNLGNKFDISHWGIELSKWSRPSYDPTQGYDNVGFRVATSLLVNSAPPTSPAPGESEFSPIQTVGATFAVAATIAAFSVKKLIDCHQDAEQRRIEAKQKEEEEAERASTADSRREKNNLQETYRDGSKIASIKEEDEKNSVIVLDEQSAVVKNSSSQPTLYSESLSITADQKAALDQDIKKIHDLFNEAQQKYEIYKTLFLQKKPANLYESINPTDVPELLKKSTEMCEAYDRYSEAARSIADKFKNLFVTESEFFIDWHKTAVDVASEAMVLRNAVIKEYYQYGLFNKLNASLKNQVILLRKASHQKVSDCLELANNYKEAIEDLKKDETDSIKKKLLTQRFQEAETEVAALEKIRNIIQEKENNIEGLVNERTLVNDAYTKYARDKEGLNSNFYTLSYFNDSRATNLKPESLFKQAQFEERLKEFFTEKNGIVIDPSDLTSPDENGWHLMDSGYFMSE